MVDDEGDGGRAGLRDPEGVPDAGGAKGAAKHPGQRHDEEHIAAEGDDHRGHPFAQTFQRAGRGGGDCRDDEAQADDAQGRGADGDGLRVGAEQADEGAGNGQAEDGANGHDGGAQAQRQVVEPSDAAMLPGTVVIADQWTHSLHDAVGRQVQKGLEFVVDAQNRDVAL